MTVIRIVTCISLFVTICFLGACQSEQPIRDADKSTGQVYEFTNAYWYNGQTFEKRQSIYSENGLLKFSSPDVIDEHVDLAGGYVIPPLCEAHNHNLGGNYQTQAAIKAYLEAGIFHVMIFSNLPAETDKERHLFNQPNTVDVVFANGGLTGPGGHPIKLREMLLGYGAYEGFTKETLADHAYFVFAEENDIEEKWPLVMALQPDFIKIFLLYSEEYEERRDNPEYFGKKGLDPDFVPLLVERAHEHGLRVAAHVETAHDFHIAIQAGVDIIAHLPGYSEPQFIASEDASLAAQKGTIVITTASLAEGSRDDPTEYSAIRDAQVANLDLLNRSGVTLALGSDNFESNSSIEASYIRELGIVSNQTLLDMWSRNCSQTVFPDRQVGQLTDNFEASFIVLSADPLEDWSALKTITYRFKDGAELIVQ